jgi:2-polyprenyl-6-methoxyphenol hydroxylase-like FAD-dependent oxidoreductase
MNVIIIGGGIGGLALARALALRDIPCRVYERAPGFADCGAALTMWSNGMRALRALGLDADVAAGGWPIVSSDVRRPDGSRLMTTPVALVSRQCGSPTFGMRRAVLHNALLAAAADIPVAFSAPCTGFSQAGDAVTATFADRSSATADLLVGADGLWSVVRRGLFGESAPRRPGYALWRGLARIHDPGLRAGHSFESWSPGVRFGMVQVDADTVYWYAGLSNGPGTACFHEALPFLRNTFGAWHDPIPRVLDQRSTHRALRTEIYDRSPLPTWRQGRVALLGDAAHPMTPDLGQGACSAVEDAVVLAECLAAGRDIESALGRYESKRRRRCERMVAKSRRLGRLAQARNPVICGARNLMTRLAPTTLVCRELRRVIGAAA